MKRLWKQPAGWAAVERLWKQPAAYNSLGLPQTITEPSTAAYTGAANSTTTDIYNGDGDLVTQNRPGGVQISNTYDATGGLTGQSGSGAAAPTATRTFTYDKAGRLLSAATTAVGTQGTPGYQPATSESFGYDDRGLLLSASGSAGTSTFTYNASAQLASATDAAGTSTFTYDSAGRLATDTDAASGTTGTYSYNSLDQLTGISYGSGNDVQSFGYDSLHRLTSDTVAAAGGAQVAALGYGYDANDNVTSMTTSGLATAGGGTGTVTNSYGYDQANRLTSWTATPAGGQAVTKTYGYDNAGNLTSNNGTAYSYDARDELTSDGSNTYTYTAGGDLASQAGPGGTATFASDAYGQQITDAVSSFSWDALGRLVSAVHGGGASIALTYDGMTSLIASDPSATYSRDPSGAVVGVAPTAGGKTLALNNQHDDLSGTFTVTGTALAGSTTWDPWGNRLATTGTSVELGYQGQWTDPGTGQTDMGSRLYKPTTGGFINADTVPAGNPYAYANDNPMSLTDPTGTSPSDAGTGNGTITKADVNAAAAQVQDDQQKAAQAQTAAAQAQEAARHARATASTAADYAKQLNNAADALRKRANQVLQQATAAYNNATQHRSNANAASNSAHIALTNLQALSAQANASGHSANCTNVPIGAVSFCVPFSDLNAAHAYASQYQAQTSRASNEAAQASDAFNLYTNLSAEYSDLAKDYALIHGLAVAAKYQADADKRLADQMEAEADHLATVAADAEQRLADDEAAYQRLKAEYDQEQREEHRHQAKQSDKKKRREGTKNSGTSGGGKGGGGGGPGCTERSLLDPKSNICRKAAAAAGGDAGDVGDPAGGTSIPSRIFREGTPGPSNLTPRPSDQGVLSFRDSLSNPWTPPELRPPNWRPVFRPGEPYFSIDTSQLRPGSVYPDYIPPGQVSVTGVDVPTLRAAVIESPPWPRFPK